MIPSQIRDELRRIETESERCTTMSDVKKDDRLELRIPAELKQEAQEAAEKDSRTLSQWVLVAIREKLERDLRKPDPS